MSKTIDELRSIAEQIDTAHPVCPRCSAVKPFAVYANTTSARWLGIAPGESALMCIRCHFQVEETDSRRRHAKKHGRNQ